MVHTSESLPLSAPADRAMPFAIIRYALLAFSVMYVLWFFGYKGADWELLTTKHYWQSEQWFYGGYSFSYTETGHGAKSFQVEGIPNFNNMLPLSEKTSAADAKYKVGGFPGTERLVASFLAYLVFFLCFGKIAIWTCFYIVNVLLWLSYIVLAYKLARLIFKDDYSPFFAALFFTFYPVVTLTFHAIKLQHTGTFLLIFSAFVYEKYIQNLKWHLQCVYLTALVFIGLFSGGGWVFLCVYFIVRSFVKPLRQCLQVWGATVVALVSAKAVLYYLQRQYNLPSVEQAENLDFGQILTSFLSLMSTWLHGGDVNQMVFLEYRGFEFITLCLPVLLYAYFLTYWAFLPLCVAALFVLPQSRNFVIVAMLLFGAGHAPNIIIGYGTWHYGYASSPSGIFVMLVAAGFLGWLMQRRAYWPKFLVVSIVAISLVGFLNYKRHAGLYYGGDPDGYTRKVILHYEGSPEVKRY